MSKRVVIVGGPRTGKTTLAKRMSGNAQHTDNTMKDGWSEGSERVAGWMGRPGPSVIEGVATARALRKWLAANPIGKPCDEVICLRTPRVTQSKGQAAMAKGVHTVFDGIAEELKRRGVVIREEP